MTLKKEPPIDTKKPSNEIKNEKNIQSEKEEDEKEVLFVENDSINRISYDHNSSPPSSMPHHIFAPPPPMFSRRTFFSFQISFFFI